MSSAPLQLSIQSPRKFLSLPPAQRGVLIQGALAVAGVGIAAAFAASGGPVRPHLPNIPLLLSAPPVVLAHAGAAAAALLVGAGLMWGRKGVALHRLFGWAWVVAMMVVVLSSFLFPFMTNRGFSPIHGLSAWVLVAVPGAVIAARRKNLAVHRRTMTGVFLFGLIVAGAFTLAPGRLLWRVFLG